MFAFENGNQVDIFVNKAPASTIGNLAKALIDLANSDNEARIINIRHGEILYKTLCTREGMINADNMGAFYRIPAGNRDLNYAMYFSEVDKQISEIDYNSQYTERYDVEKLLSKLTLVRRELFAEEIDEFIV